MSVCHWLKNVTALGVACVLALASIGCEGAAKPGPSAANSNAGTSGNAHDHGDLAIGNFAESVGTLRKFHDDIKAAFEKGKPDDAHDALHEIGHVLEALEKQVASLPAEKQDAAKQAVKTLFDAYGKIDGAMHGGDEVKYTDMSDQLSKSVETLEASK